MVIWLIPNQCGPACGRWVGTEKSSEGALKICCPLAQRLSSGLCCGWSYLSPLLGRPGGHHGGQGQQRFSSSEMLGTRLG